MKEYTFNIYTNQNSFCGDMSVYTTDYTDAVNMIEHHIAVDNDLTVDEVRDLYYVELVSEE